MIPQHIITELEWRGITPPRHGTHRTTCPHCSHERTKAKQRCMKITYEDGACYILCYHCKFEDAFFD